MLTYTVARRRSEIGIRLALGADRADIMALIGREACALMSVGIVLGTVLGGRRLECGQNTPVITPGDPASLLIAAAGFAVVSAVATAVPAVKASQLAPTVAIREE